MIEELLKVPKNLNEVLPPIENYRQPNKSSDEIIEERDRFIGKEEDKK